MSGSGSSPASHARSERLFAVLKGLGDATPAALHRAAPANDEWDRDVVSTMLCFWRNKGYVTRVAKGVYRAAVNALPSYEAVLEARAVSIRAGMVRAREALDTAPGFVSYVEKTSLAAWLRV